MGVELEANRSVTKCRSVNGEEAEPENDCAGRWILAILSLNLVGKGARRTGWRKWRMWLRAGREERGRGAAVERGAGHSERDAAFDEEGRGAALPQETL